MSVWNLAGADERMEFAGHASGVTGVSFSPTEPRWLRRVRTARSSSGSRPLVDCGDARRLSGRCPGRDFSPDGALLATGSMDKGGLRIWDTRNWQEVYAANEDAEYMGEITGLVFLRGAGTDLGLAATSRFSGLGIWRVKRNGDARPGLQPIVQHHGYECLHVALSPDGELAAYIDSDFIVKVWDVARARELAFSGPGRSLAGIPWLSARRGTWSTSPATASPSSGM